MKRAWANQLWLQVARDVSASVLVVLALWLTTPTPTPALKAAQIGLGMLAIIGVSLRHRHPRIGFVLASVATVVASALGLTADPLLLAGVALYSVAAAHGRRAFPPWLASVVLTILLVTVFIDASGSEELMRYVLFSGIALIAAWALGVNTRIAKDRVATNAAIEERMRLARDVHDVLSHSLGTIGVQAGVAAHIDGLESEQLRATLREVESLSRSSIAELRTLLTVSRTEADEALLAAPLPDLLAETAQTANTAGVRTTLSTSGIEALPISHRVTVHRIVREAVSNAIRHSGASSCDIDVAVTSESLTLVVADNGQGELSDRRIGYGLAGMEERVALLNGTFRASNRPYGGFEVSAVLPLSPAKEKAEL
ncbi:histidine kinase [Saxibacter everestensis]|uniref:histidine kinase n=1 Tax=Saxibacter everestensis TaxID=2909229 RepID=A0ABY8QW32_9MICO|nr:histidine kinase [Brevibacteriaceae bacterium ZFBP1038]